jgi:hypothetical protein
MSMENEKQAQPMASSADLVPVLFPARLETRLDGDNGGWTLRVIVIPDEAFITRHDPLPSAAEMVALGEMWQMLAAAEPSTPSPWLLLQQPAGQVAWERFSQQVGSRRAAWLARSFPPILNNGSVTIPAAAQSEEFAPNIVQGFPRRLTLWALWDDETLERLHEFQVAADALSLEFEPEPEEKGEPWWASWKSANEVGLAGNIDLPRNPDGLQALMVLGVGENNPAELLLAHAASGALGLLAPGTPTNSLDGEPAADTGKDVETWRRLTVAALVGETVQPGSGTWQVSAMLTGEEELLPQLPGEHGAPWTLNQQMVAALWPALWGHAVKDIWAFGEDAHRLAAWAAAHLFPEGPLPAIRIDDQPYGLLPTTSLAHWKVDSADPAVEEALVRHLQTMRRHWAAAARGVGNVVGADSERLLDLIARTASSERYAHRYFGSVELFTYVYYRVLGKALPQSLREWWRNQHQVLAATGRYPQRFYLTAGHYRNLPFPLVVPNELPSGMELKEVLETIADFPSVSYDALVREVLGGVVPDSLLVRLALYARFLSAADAALAQAKLGGPILDPPVADRTQPTVIEEWAPRWRQNIGTPADDVHERMRTGLHELAGAEPAELERVLRATVDSASHRIDPWVTSIAWRRLEEMQRNRAAEFVLGAYGWVDGPLRGEPGPTEGGLLHTPSYQQTLTAVILRDKFLSAQAMGQQSGNGHSPWAMNLDSRLVRLAEEIAAEVRQGGHIWQVLGRQVERVVGGRAQVELLRSQFSTHTGRASEAAVCNGIEALQNLLNPAARVVPLSSEQEAALQELDRVLDVYGDLLVMEAVHHVVAGRSDVAGVAMDAASGLKMPPTLEAVRTPRAGRSVSSNVLAVLPAHGAAPPGSGPATLADSAVAAYVAAALGGATTWVWEVESGGTPGSVSLADLDLDPIDTVLLSHDTLQQLVLAQSGAEAITGGNGSARQQRAHDLVRLLGNQPALLHELVPATLDEAARAAVHAQDSAIRLELATRYQQIVAAAVSLLIDLETAPVAAPELLRQALRWGITPPDTPGATEDNQLARAAATLGNRLATAPALDHSSSPPQVDTSALEALSASAVATAIAELVAPEGQLAILSRLPALELAGRTGLNTAQPATSLESEWLTVVAAVRARMATLEAYQLQGSLLGQHEPLLAWSNRPADPWQTEVSEDAAGIKEMTRLVVAYGPDETWGTTVAAGVVDSWSETIPDTDHVTSAAFGFNAPAARAPQAVLLAVPPIPGAPLDDDLLAQILVETRELVHARMARAQDLGAYRGLLPLAMLRTMGRGDMRLDHHTRA